MSDKITYEAISKRSHVSIATISRVINNDPAVSDRSRGRVIDAMKALKLDTSHISHKRESLIIFNAPTLNNPFYLLVARSVREELGRHGFRMMLNEDPINDETFDSFSNLLKATRAQGLITTNNLSKKHQEKLSRLLPTVGSCDIERDAVIPFVTIDDEEAARVGAKHLIANGRRRIAIINGPYNFKYSRERFSGYKKALETSNIVLDFNLVGEADSEIDSSSAKEICKQMLKSKKRPDAFFCISDVLGSAALNAALELGLRVPEDVAIVGFDDISLTRMLTPTLTTIRQPAALMGELASNMLINNIEKKGIDSYCLNTELVVRESTGSLQFYEDKEYIGKVNFKSE